MARAKEYFIFNKLRVSVNPSLHVAADLEFLRVSYGTVMVRSGHKMDFVGQLEMCSDTPPQIRLQISADHISE